MFHKIIHLNKYYELDNDPLIEIYVPFCRDDDFLPKRKTIIVVPGGGYSFVSIRESDPVALTFLERDYNVVVLKYTVNKCYPTQIKELMCTFAYLRKHKRKLGINDNAISVLGFSAGGHLSASYGLKYDDEVILKSLNLTSKDTRPNAICLGYPVINLMENTHQGTSDVISGGDDRLREELSVHKHITKDYPPTFVWTMKTDELVPYENSLLLIEALENNKVPYVSFIASKGWHGMSVCSRLVVNSENEIGIQDEENRSWVDKCDAFLSERFGRYHSFK